MQTKNNKLGTVWCQSNTNIIVHCEWDYIIYRAADIFLKMYSRESESEPESKETDPLTGLSSVVQEVNLLHLTKLRHAQWIIIMQVKGKLQQNVKAVMKRGLLVSDLAGKAGNIDKFEIGNVVGIGD